MNRGIIGYMSRLALYFPVVPHVVNRAWGVVDPLYKAYGFSAHNGVDLGLVDGQVIRAPFDCRVTKIANEPDGSGLYICLLSRGKYDFEDGRSARVEITFMHLAETSALVGMRLSVGDQVGLGGRSGKTTGSHTHMAPKRVRMQLLGTYRDLDHNDAGGTFDPTPYWNGMPAQRAAKRQ